MKRIIALAAVALVALAGTATAKSKTVRYAGASDGGTLGFAIKFKKRADGEVTPVRLLDASYSGVVAKCNDLRTGAESEQIVGEDLPDDPTLREYRGEQWFQTEGELGHITVEVRSRVTRTLPVAFGGYFSSGEGVDCYFGSNLTATRTK